jgi:membrane-bound lytic murein transglycosylase D
MRLAKEASRVSVVFFVSLLLIGTIAPLQAFGQTSGQSGHAASSTTIQQIIERAEENFLRGEEASAKGLPDIARRMFDNALDTVLQSGIDIKTNPKLDAYYRSLVERIHKHEAQPGDAHDAADRPDVAEPSVLDEVSEIKENELALTTPDGVKIFGHYDFEFSVAPPVFQFINFFVAGRGHSTMEVGLQRSGRYRQMVERVFKEEKVPLDLMWLAQAESVWKPNALSRAAAKGIWQFIPSTGSRYGLAQTTWIDERSQPEKSTRAAAKYLRWLHDHFAGDWLLAMAAYNSGENRVDSAIARCGYADFWELYKRGLLPQETRNYVPCILSIIVISKNQKRYGFDVKADTPLNYDTVELPAQTDLKVVADLIGVPYESVQDLNAELRRGTSPAGARYTIKVPKGMKKQFEVAYAALPVEQRVRKITVPAEEVADRYRSSYRVQVASYQVRRGDTLASVARRTGVSVKELAKLNRMSARGELRKGQTVKVPQTVRASRGRHGHVSRYREEPVHSRHRGGRSTHTRASRSHQAGATRGHSARRHRR